MKENTRIVTVAFVGGIVGAMFSSFIVLAWTGPTQAAPAGNVAAPVNVGPSDQVKNAGLSLNALTVFGNGVLTGKIGIGSSNIPAYTLDVTGTGRLTGSLTTGSITSGSIAANGSITNTSAITYGPVSLESWGLYNTGANGGGSIYIEPKPGTAFYITPSDWTQNLTTVINGGLQVNSQINNTSGGYRFPDGTVQTSAASGGAGCAAATMPTCSTGRYYFGPPTSATISAGNHLQLRSTYTDPQTLITSGYCDEKAGARLYQCMNGLWTEVMNTCGYPVCPGSPNGGGSA